MQWGGRLKGAGMPRCTALQVSLCAASLQQSVGAADLFGMSSAWMSVAESLIFFANGGLLRPATGAFQDAAG